MKTWRHFTHNDADALGCALVTANIKDVNCEVSFHSIGTQDDAIIDYLKELTETAQCANDLPDCILISDLSVKEETANLIVSMISSINTTLNGNIKLALVDHHATNHLNEKFDWCVVESVDKTERKISAARLLFNMMESDLRFTGLEFEDFYKLIYDISDYDTWEWKNNPRINSEYCEYMNILIHFKGIEEQFQSMVYDDEQNYPYNYLSITDDKLIQLYLQKRNEVLAKCLNYTVTIKDIDNRDIALVLLEGDYFNERMEYIYKNMPEIEYVMGISPSTRSFSFRKSSEKTTDLSLLAKLYGGGGHPDASGATPDLEIFMRWLRNYYEEYDNKVKKMKEN